MARGWQPINLSSAAEDRGFQWRIDGNVVSVEGPKGITESQTLPAPESGNVAPVVGTLVERIKQELKAKLRTSDTSAAPFESDEPRVVTAEGSL